MVTAPTSFPGDSWCLSPTCSSVSSQHCPKEEMHSFQRQPLLPPGVAPGQMMYPPNWHGGGKDPVFLAKGFSLLNLNHQQPGGNRDRQTSKVSRAQVWPGRAPPSSPWGLWGRGKAGNKTCKSGPAPGAQLVSPSLLGTSNKHQGQTQSLGAAMAFLDMNLRAPFPVPGSPSWELCLQL